MMPPVIPNQPELFPAKPRAPKHGGHKCHAIGCNVAVPPRLLMCARHWRMVPKPLQNEVWRTYRPGQERDKQPSEAYLDAALAAVRSVKRKEES